MTFLPLTEQGCQEILTTSGPFTVLVPSFFFSSAPSRTMNVTLAQQLCKQHIIAGEHILEDVGPSNTRKWWTLAGQEITINFNHLV